LPTTTKTHSSDLKLATVHNPSVWQLASQLCPPRTAWCHPRS